MSEEKPEGKYIPPRQQQALSFLRKGALAPTKISELMGVSQPHVHTLLTHLLAQGMVERIPLTYALTDAGKEAAEKIGDNPTISTPKKASKEGTEGKKDKKKKDPSITAVKGSLSGVFVKGKKTPKPKAMIKPAYEFNDDEQEGVDDPENAAPVSKPTKAKERKSAKKASDDEWEDE